jgi:hypothetical protein
LLINACFSLSSLTPHLSLSPLFTLLIIAARLTLLFFSLSLSSSMNQVVLLVISTTMQMKRKHQAFGASTRIRDWFFGDLGNWVFVEAVIGFCDCYFEILEVAAMVISAMIMESTRKCGSSNLSHHGTNQNCCHGDFDRGCFVADGHGWAKWLIEWSYSLQVHVNRCC